MSILCRSHSYHSPGTEGPLVPFGLLFQSTRWQATPVNRLKGRPAKHSAACIYFFLLWRPDLANLLNLRPFKGKKPQSAPCCPLVYTGLVWMIQSFAYQITVYWHTEGCFSEVWSLRGVSSSLVSVFRILVLHSQYVLNGAPPETVSSTALHRWELSPPPPNQLQMTNCRNNSHWQAVAINNKPASLSLGLQTTKRGIPFNRASDNLYCLKENHQIYNPFFFFQFLLPHPECYSHTVLLRERPAEFFQRGRLSRQVWLCWPTLINTWWYMAHSGELFFKFAYS